MLNGPNEKIHRICYMRSQNKISKNIFEFLVTLNKHKIKGYLLEEAGIFGGGTGMCGICDSWFCILRDRHCTVVIEEVRVKNRILTNSTAHNGIFS